MLLRSAVLHSYDPLAWSPFFYSLIGATAALTGLLFVAISNNLPRILDTGGLSSRAAEALGTLLSLVTVSGLSLVPQPVRATGVEVFVIAAVVLAVTSASQRRARRAHPEFPRSWHLSRTAATASSSVPAALGGISLMAGFGGGFYWLAAAILLGVVGAAYSAWVLLIEILR